MDLRRRLFVAHIPMALDALVIILTYFLTYLFRNQLHRIGLEALVPFSYYFPMLLWILAVWMILLKVFNCYSLKQNQVLFAQGEVFIKLILVEGLGLAIISTLLFFLNEKMISRTFLLFFCLFNFIAINLLRLITTVFLSSKINNRLHRHVLVLGNELMAEQFLAVQDEMPELLFKPDINPDFIFPSGCILKKEEWQKLTQDVMHYLMDHVVDEILLVFRNLDLFLAAPLINECRHLGLAANIILDTSEIYYPKTESEKIGPFNIISFQSYDYSPLQRLVKWLMDMAGGLAGVLVFIPAYIILGPLIKLTSPGPVLFTQTRKGKNGREFKLYKFRTMYKDAEERKKEFLAQNEMQGHVFKLKEDPRITPVGKFLRRTSLDEIPQFLNILKGEMSLVGTRPPTVDEFEAYEARHRRRLSVQPGLTGLWQVSGRNRISDFEDIVKLDTEYIDNWSIWLDIKIILKTFTVLFEGR